MYVNYWLYCYIIISSILKLVFLKKILRIKRSITNSRIRYLLFLISNIIFYISIPSEVVLFNSIILFNNMHRRAVQVRKNDTGKITFFRICDIYPKLTVTKSTNSDNICWLNCITILNFVK